MAELNPPRDRSPAAELQRLEAEFAQRTEQARRALTTIKSSGLYRESGHATWYEYLSARGFNRALVPAVVVRRSALDGPDG